MTKTEKENTDTVFLPCGKANEHFSNLVIDFMKENLHRKISVEQICKALNYNKSCVFDKFKKATDTTVMAYFMRLKVEKAKKLLRETDLSVTQIADALAFDTPNYFSKTFKRFTGYTPSTYRKMRRKAK